MNQLVHIGNDGWVALETYLKDLAIQSVLLITGRNMYSSSGAEAKLIPALEGKRVRRIYDFETNPKADDVKSILSSITQDEPYDVILAIGGGSVIDIAKLLKAFWSSGDPVSAYISKRESLSVSEIPLIVIPSTAGSGSESTHFAVVYEHGEKFSVAHADLLPQAAFVIPELLEGLPNRVAAASALDALCQGIESYWSIYSTDESSALALEAIGLAWKYITPYVLEKTPESLTQIATAANLAGRAINITKTTAPHAVSYALSSHFGTLHGHAVGILIPEFLKYNSHVTEDDVLDKRGVQWVKSRLNQIVEALGHETIDEAASALRDKISELGVEANLKELNIQTEENLDIIIENGFNPQRVNNNPRRLDKAGLRLILENS